MVLYANNSFYLTFGGGTKLFPRVDSNTYPFGLVQLAQGQLGIADSIIKPVIEPLEEHFKSKITSMYNQGNDALTALEKTAQEQLGVLNSITKPLQDIQNQGNDALTALGKSAQEQLGVLNSITKPLLDIQNQGNDALTALGKSAQEQLGVLNSITKPLQDIQKDISSMYNPEDMGLTAFEKTAVQTCFQMMQPISEFAAVFTDSLGICEDIVARKIATSLDVAGVQVGIPSRIPAKYDETKNYNKTINASSVALSEATAKMKDVNEKYVGVRELVTPSNDISEPVSSPLPSRFYVAYFDKDGVPVTAPDWVDKKLFKISDSVKGPFETLSKDIEKGTKQIRDTYNSIIDINNNSLEKALSSVNSTEEKEYIKSLHKDLTDELLLSLDGNNNPNNIPTTLSECVVKQRYSQLRTRYYPAFSTTSQMLVDKNNNPVAPYIYTPTVNISFKGVNYAVEQPFAFEQQISKIINKNNTVYFGESSLYNRQNVIASNSINPFKQNTPFADDAVTHFGHNINDVYIPDSIKDYYLPIIWEEISEYELTRDNKVVGTEKDISSMMVDIESDYFLRLIKVANIPITVDNLQKNILENYKVKIEEKKLTFFKTIVTFNANIVATSTSIQILYNKDILKKSLLINNNIYDLTNSNKTVNYNTIAVEFTSSGGTINLSNTFKTGDIIIIDNIEYPVILATPLYFYLDIADGIYTEYKTISSIIFSVPNDLNNFSYVISSIENYIPVSKSLVITGFDKKSYYNTWDISKYDINGDDNLYNIVKTEGVSIYTDYSVSSKYWGKIYDKRNINIFEISSGKVSAKKIPDIIPFENKLMEATVIDTELRRGSMYSFLVEAIHKDDPSIVELINKNKQIVKKKSVDGSDDWYDYTDSLTANLKLVTKLVPIVNAKMLPIISKTLVKLNDPKAFITGFLLDDNSPLPRNYKPFSKKAKEEAKKVYERGNQALMDLEKLAQEKLGVTNSIIKPLQDLTSMYNKGNVSLSDLEKLAQEQIGDTNSIIKPLQDLTTEKVKKKILRTITNDYYDGEQLDPKALPIMSYDGSASLDEFGLTIALKNGIISAEKMTTTQPFIQLLLQIVKMPMKVLSDIFNFLKDFIKKLVKIATMPAAVEEFLTFEWLFKILSDSNLSNASGFGDISKIKNSLNNLLSQNFSMQDVYNIRKINAGTKLDSFEIYVYNLVKQNVVLSEEKNNKPIFSDDPKISPELSKPLDIASLGLPIDMPEYPSYMLPILKDNMEKQVLSQIMILEKMMSSVVNIPTSIFGL